MTGFAESDVHLVHVHVIYADVPCASLGCRVECMYSLREMTNIWVHTGKDADGTPYVTEWLEPITQNEATKNEVVSAWLKSLHGQ